MSAEKVREKDRKKDDSDSLEIIAEQSKGPSRCCYCHADNDEPVEPLRDKNNVVVASYHPSCRAEQESTTEDPLESRVDVDESAQNYRKYLIKRNKHAKYSQWEKLQQTEEVVRSIADIYELIENFFGISEHKLRSGIITTDDKNDSIILSIRELSYVS